MLRQQFHAWGVIVGGFAIFAYAHITGGDTAHRAIGVVQHFSGSKTWVNFNAHAFGLFGQPAREQTQADDVIAMVLEIGRCRHFFGFVGRQEQKRIFCHWTIQRRAQFFPIGEQFTQRHWVYHCARQDVRTDFRAFFNHANADFFFSFVGQLFQTDGCRQTRRTCAYHHHIKLHAFAFCVLYHV